MLVSSSPHCYKGQISDLYKTFSTSGWHLVSIVLLVCVCLCLSVCVCTCMLACRGQVVDDTGYISHYSLPYSPDTGSVTEPKVPGICVSHSCNAGLTLVPILIFSF